MFNDCDISIEERQCVSGVCRNVTIGNTGTTLTTVST